MKTSEIASANRVILVIGPARSGKSELAEILARNSGKSVLYLATAQVDPGDAEWQARIQQHQRRRPPNWTTLEVPINLATIVNESPKTSCCLVDSLGTWLANFLDQNEEEWEKTVKDLLQSLDKAAGNVILVAEETGWGVVPAYPIGRKFRDRLGMLVRRVAAIANPVFLVTGGHVLNLTALGSPLPDWR
jgi:adenosylcobinamide kinase/adenosylcobinamide-phosphate guanylyltransferase